MVKYGNVTTLCSRANPSAHFQATSTPLKVLGNSDDSHFRIGRQTSPGNDTGDHIDAVFRSGRISRSAVPCLPLALQDLYQRAGSVHGAAAAGSMRYTNLPRRFHSRSSSGGIAKSKGVVQ